MLSAHLDRLWAVGGATVAVALLVLGWLFLISPQYSQANGLREQADVTDGRRLTLQSRLAELQQQNADLEGYKAKLTSDRMALPTDSGLPDFLRQAQRAGDAAGVTVTGITVGAPRPLTAAGAPLQALQITMTATGSGDRLGRLLVQLQQVQPRAVLVTGASTTTTGTGSAEATLTLNLQVFVAPATPPPAPAAAAPRTGG